MVLPRLLLARVGQDGLHAPDRFIRRWARLSGGIARIPALVGAFGFAEILATLAKPAEVGIVEKKDPVLLRFREAVRHQPTVLRSGVIGILTGLLPGVGGAAGAWMSCAAVRAVSRERDHFGKAALVGRAFGRRPAMPQ